MHVVPHDDADSDDTDNDDGSDVESDSCSSCSELPSPSSFAIMAETQADVDSDSDTCIDTCMQQLIVNDHEENRFCIIIVCILFTLFCS